jgi:4-hydroxy-tetrahydrodipicolinate synthase
MVLPPHYYKSASEDGLFAWYAKVIEGVGDDIRLFLYNIPHMAGVTLSVSLVHRLREAFPQQVVGIKDSSGDAENARALLRIAGLTVYLGSEMLAALTHAEGCAGTITATANLNARAVSDYIAAVQEGDAMGVEYLREPVGAAREAMASRGYIPTPKRVLAMRTGDARWANVRPPFIEASGATAEALEQVLKDLTS